MSVLTSSRRRWHPVTGAITLALPCLLAVLLAVGGSADAGAVVGGLTAFLVMGAVAGFSVSGST
ncbi:hypothetical protein [Mobilicoccus caccae]|uniref:Uncharacterized protein n=1 Tax=Mobilicoccus caccae TaxID=1859295 RepID=A0ABQ6IN69_9MICO|nr:hypothetical protein [Mobilicoccus caccae]GMA38871.1 hypothetical protein GCM10025883_09160 [Mobilicoccus caccae]